MPSTRFRFECADSAGLNLKDAQWMTWSQTENYEYINQDTYGEGCIP